MSTEPVYVKLTVENWERYGKSLIECYRRVFASDPWFEWKKCPICGKKWGLEQKFSLCDLNFQHCDHLVEEFWPAIAAEQTLTGIIKNEKYSGWIAIVHDDNKNEKVIGFGIGCIATPDEAESILALHGSSARINRAYNNPYTVIYLEDIGVLDEYRGRGFSKKLLLNVLKDLERDGIKYLVARTKTCPPTILFVWFMNKLNCINLAFYHDTDDRVVLGRHLDGLQKLLG